MTAGEVIQLFRSESVEANRYFVVDSELYRYLNEGYVEFVRQTGGTPDEIQIDAEKNEPEVEIPAYVMRIKRATLDNATLRNVAIINYTDLNKPTRSDYGTVSTLDLNLNEVGEIRYLIVGAKKHIGRFVSIPESDQTVNLLVDRMPMDKIASEKSRFTDIDEVHQPAMLDWLKARAFRRPHELIFNPKLAEFFEERFNQIVFEANAAQNLFKSKVRAVQYGGL